jgi:hypothetical protein
MQHFFTHEDEDGDQIFVGDLTQDRASIVTTDTVYVDKEDAPALALAILRSTGWDTQFVEDMNAAIENEKARLAQIEADIDRAIAAAEAAQLDYEALTLLNAAIAASGREPFASLAATQSSSTRDFWRAAARKARELHSAN